MRKCHVQEDDTVRYQFNIIPVCLFFQLTFGVIQQKMFITQAAVLKFYIKLLVTHVFVKFLHVHLKNILPARDVKDSLSLLFGRHIKSVPEIMQNI